MRPALGPGALMLYHPHIYPKDNLRRSPPNGRKITPRSQGATQTITTRLRNRKDRRTIILIITSGYRDPATYRITHQARYR